MNAEPGQPAEVAESVVGAAVSVPFAGGCACGAVRYECIARPLRMVNCHCRDCQVASGSAYSATVIMSRSAVRLTRGEPAHFEKVADSGNTARRSYCAACGTPLFASSTGSVERIGVKVSSLDDPSWYEPEANVWLDSAPPWHRPDPQVPGFARSRPSAGTGGRDA
jgi:hypothetical protein